MRYFIFTIFAFIIGYESMLFLYSLILSLEQKYAVAQKELEEERDKRKSLMLEVGLNGLLRPSVSDRKNNL
jgi:hypothetical protein